MDAKMVNGKQRSIMVQLQVAPAEDAARNAKRSTSYADRLE